MKLTDDKIQEHITGWLNSDVIEFDPVDFKQGMEEARDFYENQTCETCKYSGKCKIEEIGKLVMDPFGCRKWEPRA